MSCANRGITYEFAALFWSASSFTVVKVLFLTCRKLGVGQPVLHDRTPRSGRAWSVGRTQLFPQVSVPQRDGSRKATAAC